MINAADVRCLSDCRAFLVFGSTVAYVDALEVQVVTRYLIEGPAALKR